MASSPKHINISSIKITVFPSAFRPICFHLYSQASRNSSLGSLSSPLHCTLWILPHPYCWSRDSDGHFFLPKSLSSSYSMTLLSRDSPLIYLAVLSNPPRMPLFSCCQGFVLCLSLILHVLSVQPNARVLVTVPHVRFHSHSTVRISSQSLFLEFLVGISISSKTWYTHLSIPAPPHPFVLKWFS